MKRLRLVVLCSILLGVFVLTLFRSCTPERSMVDIAKGMVWGKSGKSLNTLLKKHPLVEKDSIEWYLDDTTDPEMVVLEFSCSSQSREFARKVLERAYGDLKNGDPDVLETYIDLQIVKEKYKIAFVVGSQIVKVTYILKDNEFLIPDKNISFDNFINNLERLEKDYISFWLIEDI